MGADMETNAASEQKETDALSSKARAARAGDGRRKDNLSKEQRKRIGQLGGAAVAKNPAHMAKIGRKGGLAVSKDREHMAIIGRIGGSS